MAVPRGGRESAADGSGLVSARRIAAPHFVVPSAAVVQAPVNGQEIPVEIVDDEQKPNVQHDGEKEGPRDSSDDSSHSPQCHGTKR
jgi:hypothetical protein